MEGWIVDTIVPEWPACWQSCHVVNNNSQAGWERRAYKWAAGDCIGTSSRPSQTSCLPNIVTSSSESHHGYTYPVSLAPSGLPTSPLRPLHGRAFHRLAVFLALVLVFPLDAPFHDALVQLVRQWPQWGNPKRIQWQNKAVRNVCLNLVRHTLTTTISMTSELYTILTMMSSCLIQR